MSSNCRAALGAMLTYCHRVAINGEIKREWDEHQSRWAMKWRAGMVARKKLVVLEDPGPDLERAIDGLGVSEATGRAMKKDAHLVDAALKTDRRILSRDSTARRLYASASGTLNDTRDVHWVMPEDRFDVIEWINNGAPEDPAIQLPRFREP